MSNSDYLDKAIKYLEANSYKNNYTNEALKLLKIMKSQDNVPDSINPVLAELTTIGDLNTFTWYEILYYDTQDKKWNYYSSKHSFDSANTKVLKWKYCSDVFKI